ncbi:PepSY domain-containing protein [Priestia taiwanensis]|uniref:PepSY domain-containing protein n=1 Tax=Priestia taiwanensis TaxID=1347902 RepID=A0A917AVN4_9BACI|nr:PepSY domain-containing protein [Priestia taiwanensis]MBM7364711.1 putative membrane protein YkoI [Priestia taiwanensis]GGE79046.1 hypothetical protein GCM10007140_30750 [Priestia taiwanensis]
MKKKWKIALLASFAIVTIVFGAQRIIATQDKVVLAKEDIEAIVEKQYDGNVGSMELTSEDVYSITFSNKKGKYKLLVNAYTGEVIELEETELISKEITEEEAKERAKQQVDGEVISIKLEEDIYVVEIQKKDNSGIEVVKIEKKTGELVSQGQQPEKPPTQITAQEAEQTASNHVVGGTILGTALIESNKGPVYNISMKQGNNLFDVRVHAITRDIVSTTKKSQASSDDDDDDDDKDDNKQQPNNTEKKPPNKQQPAQKPKQPNDDDNDDQGDDDGQDDD